MNTLLAILLTAVVLAIVLTPFLFISAIRSMNEARRERRALRLEREGRGKTRDE